VTGTAPITTAAAVLVLGIVGALLMTAERERESERDRNFRETACKLSDDC